MELSPIQLTAAPAIPPKAANQRVAAETASLCIHSHSRRAAGIRAQGYSAFTGCPRVQLDGAATGTNAVPALPVVWPTGDAFVKTVSQVE